ncbi:MAG TPA: ArsS family sensor histidine kinase [Sulfurovum sp.]|jgi:two-component system OmpR family sensor kinase|nr:MAG: two-component sensor histidine kinase [Sulfurovum sp. 35-42-20]OYY57226.1 MAG: two-component sensor histidine kinase [Sulfurovum sp. 28-43-6]OYZ26846.1 MAG: two-component sensor histidine kinase [Sulfurovum sp. 16-42-52]OYZ49918.1 MAG: two-component sensor histidine kinase [Sulfurovum sp. 24-42-9]OZA46642.1 MAG: two-component sensor histidine kinase [Sulfurovum sp. 17-42-90]OZA60222.1 MAG: two-component sensor histidine kinase [Sulfurovum sp. 39-42-12]HQR73118.1 ArsS family sensor his
MRNLPVTTFIHVLFSVALLILIATFLLFLSWDKDRHKIEEYKHYQLVSLTFLSKLELNPQKEDLAQLYKDLLVKEVKDEKAKEIKKEIEIQGTTVFTGGSSVGRVRVFNIRGTHYIYVQRMEHNLLLQDDRPENYFFEIAVTLGIFLIGLLLLVYLAVLKKLEPLKTLHKQIQRFAKGDTQTRITYLYDDEIGKIAKSFDDAIRYINTLSASKNLFMRNLMHELKTPITKGRIIVEMLDDEATKEVLIRAFERMNELISELAEVERVTTQSFEPNFEYTMLDEVIRRSQELLMTIKGRVIIDVENIALTTDVKLLSLAIKNLLDNGIKYSKNKEVTLKSTPEGSLEVISQGEALQHPFSYYIEPFSQEEKRSSGFGLGLYIVHSIVEKLGWRLGYRYEAGNNIFVIYTKNPRA